MGKCILCGGDTSWAGTCKVCGLENNLTKEKKDHYEFVFKGGEKINIPLEGGVSLEDFIKKNKNKIVEMIDEQRMAGIGYHKGGMCPFTQVKIGGTRAATLAFTGASMDEFVWTHSECLKEYCAIWDSNDKQCSIMTIAKKLK